MIHVLIERHIAEGMLPTYKELSRKALQRTYIEHGFISGETFSNSDDIHQRFVLCKWRSREDWNRWRLSQERIELMNSIAPTLNEREKVLILEN